MSKTVLTPVPDTEEGSRLELDAGWVRMAPMDIDAMEAFSETSEGKIGPAIRALKRLCLEAHFDNGKPLGEQQLPVLSAILKAWNSGEDEAALPPANGQL